MLVYELADTDGKPLRGESGLDPFATRGRLQDGAIGTLVDTVANQDGIEVKGVPLGYLRAGDVRALRAAEMAATNGPIRTARFLIRYANTLDREAAFATLVHELAHVYCGHLGAKPGDWWPHRLGQLTAGQQELEAEAVTKLICRRAGLTTSSAEYLAGHVRDEDLVTISIDAVLRAANRIENMMGVKHSL